MKFYSRKMIKHEDLNHASQLFGGTVLAWIDEEAWVFACCQMKTTHVVTKFMSEIEFISSAKLGEVIEIGINLVHIGTTSVALACQVRNKITKKIIVHVDKIIMVSVDKHGTKIPHGINQREPNNKPQEKMQA
ncbi:hotdog domain-containing protein [Maricurvus nonylphenolicus]|uniref:acyl-CoA thioesterase n=1 Tax=Maricurvus nonylphenolicus TaxID=1008307 RepID=UPI0036F2576F